MPGGRSSDAVAKQLVCGDETLLLGWELATLDWVTEQ
jgi:hypothetical protein